MAIIDELFTKYYDDIYRYLYSLCRDTSLAEDLTSEVFLEVVKSICSFRSESDIKTWLFSIARHRWFHYLKKKKQNVEVLALADFEQLTDVNIEEQYNIKQIVERIYEMLDEESELTRKNVKMRLEGYSFYEIGIALDISENSARVIYFRAKEKIRKRLKEEGYSYD